jgi:hypothetical protein
MYLFIYANVDCFYVYCAVHASECECLWLTKRYDSLDGQIPSEHLHFDVFVVGRMNALTYICSHCLNIIVIMTREMTRFCQYGARMRWLWLGKLFRIYDLWWFQ